MLLLPLVASLTATPALAGGGRRLVLVERSRGHEFAVGHSYGRGRKQLFAAPRHGHDGVVKSVRVYDAATWSRLQRTLGAVLPDPSRPHDVKVLAPYRAGTSLTLPGFVRGKVPGVDALQAYGDRNGASHLGSALRDALIASGDPAKVVRLANDMTAGKRPAPLHALDTRGSQSGQVLAATLKLVKLPVDPQKVRKSPAVARTLAALAMVKPELLGSKPLDYVPATNVSTSHTTSSSDRTVRVRYASQGANGSVLLTELRYPLSAIQAGFAGQTHAKHAPIQRLGAAHGSAERGRVRELAKTVITTANMLRDVVAEVNARANATGGQRLKYDDLAGRSLAERVDALISKTPAGSAPYNGFVDAIARRTPVAFGRGADSLALPRTLDAKRATADQIAVVGRDHVRDSATLNRIIERYSASLPSDRQKPRADSLGSGQVRDKWRELVFWAERRSSLPQLVAATRAVTPRLFGAKGSGTTSATTTAAARRAQVNARRVARSRGTAAGTAAGTPVATNKTYAGDQGKWWTLSAGRYDALIKGPAKALLNSTHTMRYARRDGKGRPYHQQFGNIARPLDASYDFSVQQGLREGGYGGGFPIDVRVRGTTVSVLQHVYLEFEPHHTPAQRRAIRSRVMTAVAARLSHRVELVDRQAHRRRYRLHVDVKVHDQLGNLDRTKHAIKITSIKRSNTRNFDINASAGTVAHEMAHRILNTLDEYVDDKSRDLAPLRLQRQRKKHSRVGAFVTSLMRNSHDKQASLRPVHFEQIARIVGVATGRRLGVKLLHRGQDGRLLR